MHSRHICRCEREYSSGHARKVALSSAMTCSAIPSAYILSLKRYVSEKLDASEHRPGFAALYEQQLRYVQALEDQLPANKAVATGQHVVVSVPKLTKLAVARQGPFLLQPEPCEIAEGSSDAVDFAYVQVKTEAKLELGVAVVSYQNGKVDILLDLDKVEARWEHGQAPVDTDQTLTVFESVDLGTCESLRRAGCHDIVEATTQNSPVFYVDPVYSDTIYVYHLLGVHCLWLRRWATQISGAIAAAGSQPLRNPPPEALTTDVICMFDTTFQDKS
jgi:nucleoporin NUP82